jgi:hypothetical protein
MFAARNLFQRNALAVAVVRRRLPETKKSAYSQTGVRSSAQSAMLHDVTESPAALLGRAAVLA